jgi:hypothetical protein
MVSGKSYSNWWFRGNESPPMMMWIDTYWHTENAGRLMASGCNSDGIQVVFLQGVVSCENAKLTHITWWILWFMVDITIVTVVNGC